MSSFDRDDPDMTSEELFERIMDIAADDRKREAETGEESRPTDVEWDLLSPEERDRLDPGGREFIRDHFQIIHVK